MTRFIQTGIFAITFLLVAGATASYGGTGDQVRDDLSRNGSVVHSGGVLAPC